MLKILGIGDNVCDLYLHAGTMYPGGQALNVAVFAAMCGQCGQYLGVFGTDEVARHVKKCLDELRVPYPRARTVAGENGYAKVRLVSGDRVFVSSNKGGVLGRNPLTLDGQDLAYIGQFDIVHTSNNSYMDGQLDKLSGLGPWISYDFSAAWRGAGRLEGVCANTHIAFLSADALDGDGALALARRANAARPNTLVITMGGQGAWCYSAGQLYRQAVVPVQAVDTLGAGDSFAAQFLVAAGQAARRRGASLGALPGDIATAALGAAAQFAAKTCTVHGAFGHGAPIPPRLL